MISYLVDRTQMANDEILANIESALDKSREVRLAAGVLSQAGFDAYLVGGCVRDIILGKKPKDWDIATNAKPEEIMTLFPDSFYENAFGTVGVKTDSEDPTLKIIEVTTFRKEGKYSDARRPDDVSFTNNILDDLERRDFTMNAVAYFVGDGREPKDCLADPFDGIADIEKRLIRAVREPEVRFSEDALRLMRAVRLYAQLGFDIEEKTEEAIRKKADLLGKISKERIRDELANLIMSDNASLGIRKLEDLALLKYVLPTVREGINVGQNKHHIYTVFEHNVRALEYSAKQGYSLEVRLASLLHDVGKPKTKRGEGPDSTFYGHQVVGARMAKKELSELTFSKKIIDKVELLIREHMFVYDPEMVTLAGVRRLLRRVGVENIDDLIKVREADRIGSGVPKAVTYNLRHLMAMIDKVKADPISPKMVKLNGDDLISELGMKPGPRMGAIISVILEEVLENPEINDRDKLLKRAEELDKLSDEKLRELAEDAKRTAVEAQDRIDEEIKAKHYVK